MCFSRNFFLFNFFYLINRGTKQSTILSGREGGGGNGGGGVVQRGRGAMSGGWGESE